MNSSQLSESVTAIRRHWPLRPRVAVILGTGLGELAQHVDCDATIDFADIPHFVPATALGHLGQFACGHLEGVPALAMVGRIHAYEGYSPAQITYPVRVMAELGIETLIVTNASGGMNPCYRTGEILVIEDHINLMWSKPRCGGTSQLPTPHSPHSTPYDRALVERALAIAREENFVAHRGVYAGVLGPNFETRAEYRFLRSLGADTVGMSTVPEALVASHLGLRVLGLSTITNVCDPDALSPTSGEVVLQTAAASSENMRRIICGILPDWATCEALASSV